MKSFTVITSAPQGTLGDPSSSSKLIKQLLKKHPDLRIKFIITGIDQPTHYDVVKGIVPVDPRVEVQYSQDPFNSFSQIGPTENILLNLTAHFISSENLTYLMEPSRNIMVATAYSRVGSPFAKNLPPELTNTFNKMVTHIDSGLGYNPQGEMRLGIYISDPKEKKLPALFSSLPPKDRKSLKKFFGNSDQDFSQYKNKTNLYFGYYNNLIDLVSKQNNFAEPSNFVKHCVALSLQSYPQKSIDIIIPLKVENTSHKEDIINKLDIENKNLSVEFWLKNKDTGKITCTDTIGFGQTTVRIINPFPIEPDTMQFMFEVSHPFTMVTGNQSFSEALSHDKLFLYQVMGWEDELYSNITQIVESLFSENDLYRKFFVLLNSHNTNEEELIRLLSENQTLLLQGAQKLHDFIYKEYNLENNITDYIYNHLQNNNPIPSSIKEDPTLVQFLHLYNIYEYQSMDHIAQVREITQKYFNNEDAISLFLAKADDEENDIWSKESLKKKQQREILIQNNDPALLAQAHRLRELIYNDEDLTYGITTVIPSFIFNKYFKELPDITNEDKEKLNWHYKISLIHFLGLESALLTYNNLNQYDYHSLSEEELNHLLMISIIMQDLAMTENVLDLGASPSFSILKSTEIFSPLYFCLKPEISHPFYHTPPINLPLLKILSKEPQFDAVTELDKLFTHYVDYELLNSVQRYDQPEVIDCFIASTTNVGRLREQLDYVLTPGSLKEYRFEKVHEIKKSMAKKELLERAPTITPMIQSLQNTELAEKEQTSSKKHNKSLRRSKH